MREAITFSDVAIIPAYSDVDTRTLVDLSSTLDKKFSFKVPIIASNMSSIMNSGLAAFMNSYGGGSVLHRFQTIDSAAKQFNDLRTSLAYANFNIGVSVGIKKQSRERALVLYANGAKVFCIDVAHGHHKEVGEMIGWMKSAFPDIFLIAGNVCTQDGAKTLSDWGADCIKVGIGSSTKICSTRIDTGVGTPQLSALQRCRDATDKPIICDGGCYYAGDFAKALKYCDAIMSGSLFAGTDLASGRVRHRFNLKEFRIVKQKEYYGSASLKNKGEKKHIEGRSIWIPYKGGTYNVLEKIKEGMKSSFSYVGAKNIEEFKEKCQFERVSFGGHHEGVR